MRSRVATLQRNAPNDLAGAGRPQLEALDIQMADDDNVREDEEAKEHSHVLVDKYNVLGKEGK
jgi:hypothetical protein